jgi:hypothetical protein
MAIAFVQDDGSVEDGGGSDTTQVVVFGSNVTAGNLIVVSIGYGGAIGTPSCADSLSNSYTVEASGHSVLSNQSQALFWAEDISGGACTVTVTLSPAASFRRMQVSEYSGLVTASPSDGSAITADNDLSTATDGTQSDSITTGENGDLIYGWCQNFDEADPPSATITGGTGFTQRGGVGSGICVGEDKIQASAGSVNATFTLDIGSTCLVTVLALKAAAAGAASRFMVVQ